MKTSVRSLPIERRLPVLLGILFCTVVATGVGAQTVEVDDDNCPNTGNGTPGNPYCKIQDGICDLENRGTGGTVLVHPGTYNESLRMFDGVHVQSTNGPAETTIDGSGQPCTTRNCTVNTQTTSCSTVVYGFEGGNARLEGFRITGGAGIFRNVSGRQFVAGGGVFMVGNISPVITNNEIVGNVLFDATTHEYLGAGIYVEGLSQAEVATPQITNNVIADNVNDPVDGTGPGTNAYALGGGIYLGLYTATVLEGNLIRNNSVGDPAKSYVRANGGAAVIYSWSGEPTISRNTIRDNSSSDLAGAFMMGELQVATTLATVENNIFEYNHADRAGGAIHTGTTTAKFRSNTVTDNSAELYGGGFYVGASEIPTSQTTLVNNLIVFNSVLDYTGGLYVGGGLYVNAQPSVTYNDLHGNTPENVGGQRRDSDYIGQDGNIDADPLFANRSATNRYLGLTSGSPVVDVGNDAEAPSTDIDGAPRIVDGNGDSVARIDLGAYEFDPNAADFDGDGIPDVSDPDDDNDGEVDGFDCDPFNASVSRVAGPIGATLRVGRNGSTAELSWQRGEQGFVSNVYRGTIISGQPFSYNEVCFDPENPATDSSDPDLPPLNDSYYYFISARNICGESRMGQDNIGGVQNDLFPAVPCASQSGDSDTDSVLDVTDNCPLDINADQADADRDFFGDVCDCAPNDATNSPPGEVSGVVVDKGASFTEVSWSDLGTGRYDVAGGLVSELLADGGVPAAVCLEDDSADTLFEDTRGDPLAGAGYYYMVRGQNACGGGSYGAATAGPERLPTSACP